MFGLVGLVLLGLASLVIVSWRMGWLTTPEPAVPSTAGESATNNLAAESSSETEAVTTDGSIITQPTGLSGPLEAADFPRDTRAYPEEWSDAWRYPDTFRLVGALQGFAAGVERPGWQAKLRFTGSVAEAAEALETFFRGLEWTISERTALPEGGLVLWLSGPSGGSGLIVCDPDPEVSTETRVLATVFP